MHVPFSRVCSFTGHFLALYDMQWCYIRFFHRDLEIGFGGFPHSDLNEGWWHWGNAFEIGTSVSLSAGGCIDGRWTFILFPLTWDQSPPSIRCPLLGPISSLAV